MTEAGAPVLSVVVPAYNEAARIAGSLERISGYLMSLPYDSELIVVDDGSDEAGRKAVEDAVAVLRSGLTRRLMRHETNRGKGAAVRSGCLAAHGRYVTFLDADLATPPEAMGGLIEALEAGADVAVGVRNQADGTDMRNGRSLTRRIAGKAFAGAVGMLLLPGLQDSQCPMKAFRGEAAQRLFELQRIETWSFDAEVLYLARRLGMKTAQVPVAWSAVEGSHMRLSRAAGELLNLLRIRWMHRGVRPGR
jgi:glycosyltransferase involved in cell wall biosynthesis